MGPTLRTRIPLAVVSITLAVLLFLLSVACTRHQDFDRALAQEKKGDYTAAMDSYRLQIASTPASQNKHISELYYRVGECLVGLERPAEAFSAYNKAVELDDHNQAAHLRLGELFLMAGAGDRATAEANAALKHSGVNMDALALLGSAAAANGQDEIAREMFTKVLTAEPGRVKIALSLADVYLRQGNPDGARETLTKAAAAQPLSATPLLALGRLEEQEGKSQAAEEAYTKAVKAENSPEANLRLAQFLQRAARVPEAEMILKQVDKLRPQLPIAMADFQFMSGRAPQASQKYLDALNAGRPASEIHDLAEAARAKESRAKLVARLVEADLAAGNGGSREKAEWCSGATLVARAHYVQFGGELDDVTRNLLLTEIAIADNDLPLAATKAQAMVEAAPESAAAHYVLGMVKFRSNDATGARSEWDAALEQDPRFVPARLALASLMLKTRDLSAAQDYVVPAVREEPGNFSALMLFARLLILQKNNLSARVIARRAAIVDPTSAEPHLINGQIALNEKKPGEALLEFQQAVLLEPRSRDAIEGLTEVYRSGNVKREMLVQMERTADSEPSSPALLEIAGRLYGERGFKQDARRCLERAIELDPARQSAATALAQLLAKEGEFSAATDSATKVGTMSPLLNALRAQDRNDLKAAIDSYETAVKSGDKSGVAANNLAWIYAEQETNLDRAMALAQKARDLAPENAGVLDTVGYVHLKRREFTQAVSALENAVQMASRQPEGQQLLNDIKRHLAEAYLRNGQTRQAAVVASPIAANVGAGGERHRRF